MVAYSKRCSPAPLKMTGGCFHHQSDPFTAIR
jgi:hypothetical protein